MTEYVLIPPFQIDPDTVRNGTPFVGQMTVDAEGKTITNEPFYPAISVDSFMRSRSLDDSFSHEHIVDALIMAMMRVNRELTDFAYAFFLNGITRLADIPCAQIGGLSTKVVCYLNAVYSSAHASLVMRLLNAKDTTGKAQSKELLDEMLGNYQRERFEALQMLLGKNPTISGVL